MHFKKFRASEPNKIWVDKGSANRTKYWLIKGSEFCNSLFQKQLKDNHIEMYSTHNKGKSVAAERFIRT